MFTLLDDAQLCTEMYQDQLDDNIDLHEAQHELDVLFGPHGKYHTSAIKTLH